MKRRAAVASVRPAGSPSVAPATPTDGLKRVAIEAVTPEIDSGRFPAKRVVGETVVVEADIFTDGHDALAAIVRYRHKAAMGWRETPMAPLGSGSWPSRYELRDRTQLLPPHPTGPLLRPGHLPRRAGKVRRQR